MTNKMLAALLAAVLVLGLTGCGDGDDASSPTDPQNPTGPTVMGSLAFNDFGADARRVLPPVYSGTTAKAGDAIWNEGDYPILGKVFSEDEPMSIHANLALHDEVMTQIEQMLAQVAEIEAETGEIPTEPIPFDDGQHGSGTLTVQFVEAPAAIPVPAACRTVFGAQSVTVAYALQMTVAYGTGESWASPYFGVTASDSAQVVYYWAQDPDGTQLFLATKDPAADTFDIAGAYFKPDGPGDEDRCNWVYHVTGHADDAFTYNMGWYSESPAFELFACVQGSGDRDTEFGLRYHQYTDRTGWDTLDDDYIAEDVFGPVDGDPYAFIDEANRAGTIADYVDTSVMYVRDDSPLAPIPNPFLGVLE